MIQAIANALNFSFYGPESGSDSLEEQLINFLRQKKMLLILDNFEHLLPGIDFLLELLQNASGIKLLITSRERLNISAEWLLPIEGLSYTWSNKAADDMPPAQALFIQRAQQKQPDFDPEAEKYEIDRICQLTVGMPLGLELAATSVDHLTCHEIAEQIQQNLDFLSSPLRDIPQRHRNLRAVFEHSWTTLSKSEQDAFQRLSIFQGGFSAEAAEAITHTSDMTLVRLQHKSILRADAQRRYQLHQLIQQYAAEKLQQSPQFYSETAKRHAQFYADLLYENLNHLKGPRQNETRQLFNLEIDNIRLAWSWALTNIEVEAEIDSALSVFEKAL